MTPSEGRPPAPGDRPNARNRPQQIGRLVLKKRVIRPSSIHPTQGYVHGVLTSGGLLFISAQVAKNPADENVGDENLGEADIEAQLVQIFENIKAVLEEAGGDFSNVVKISVYFTDRAQLPVYRDVRARYLGDDDGQAATGMIVAAMPNPAWMMEIEAVADLGE